MIRFVLLVVLGTLLARMFWRVVDSIIEGATERPRGSAAPRRSAPSVPTSVQMLRDPVCGTFVVPDRAVMLVEGRTRVAFCSEACRDRYRARTA